MERLKIILASIWKFLKPHLIKFHTWRKRIWRKYQINKIIILLTLILVLVSSAYLFYLAKTANVKILKSSLSAKTEIYDYQGTEAGYLFGQKGMYVKLDRISPHIQDAVISTEDKTFYKNRGVDIFGIFRAAVRSVLHGGIVGGGSTITQQLAKNAYLTQKQTWDRKARELFLAFEINKKYSKQDILTMYLNNSYFGNGIWGIEDASHKYFGKSASEVNIGEAAILAGLLKGPEIYNPINYPKNAKNRRDTVLQLMVRNKKLSQKEADDEANVDIASQSHYVALRKDNYKYPSFFDAVISEAEKKAKISEQDILTKGYKIYTTLNQNYQKAMQNFYADTSNFPKAIDNQVAQSASIAMDPENGGVQALVGEVGDSEKHIFRSFNYATQSVRSPGSAIKPLVVYTPAIQQGYKMDEMLPNNEEVLQEIVRIPGFDQADNTTNYGNTYSADMPMYQALAKSLNISAVYLESKIGLDKAFNTGKKFGLPLQKEDKYYGLALGGLARGVSPWTMTQAYGTFGNGGEMVEAHLINKIMDATGDVVYEANPETKSVVSKETAKKMTSMMLGTFSNGTGASAVPSGYKLAGKTGTTETKFDASKSKDQWVIGYNPDVVITTWLGFEKTDENHYLEVDSVRRGASIFRSIANWIMPLTSKKTFDSLYPGIQDAYSIAGEDTENLDQDTEPVDNKVKNLKKKAEDVLKKAKEKAGKIAKIVDKAKEGINKIKNIFGGD
ncbi:MAG: PBP1A family penicillin-binding protein [Streptococcaceae bacterium]|jgi:penicillin-binding protein 2A|nr:PBP1A family penicillin-binding protein [Streptococcaceae bacterium]